MRYLILLLCTTLICVGPVGGQIESDDPYSMTFVQTNLRIASATPGLIVGAVVKNWQRLGDGVSIALLKILDEEDFRNPKTVESFLPLIRQSFSYPPIVSVDVNKKPKVTMFLLRHLEQNVSDAQTRRDIQETIQYVEHQTASVGAP